MLAFLDQKEREATGEDVARDLWFACRMNLICQGFGVAAAVANLDDRPEVQALCPQVSMIFSKTRTQPLGWIMACYDAARDAAEACSLMLAASSKPPSKLATPKCCTSTDHEPITSPGLSECERRKGSAVHGFYCDTFQDIPGFSGSLLQPRLLQAMPMPPNTDGSGSVPRP